MTRPACAYCDETEGLRQLHDMGGHAPQDYVCEDCFTATDDGPCFDDLPMVLIAAAPEMLEALVGIKNDPTIRSVMNSSLWHKLTSAIEKAEGKS